jgi:1-deoxy-D-xylulose-5-phosphate reductoisomerase
MSTVLNAANEVAVDRFRAGAIPFPRIWGLVAEAMAAHQVLPQENLENILAADQWAREFTRGL